MKIYADNATLSECRCMQICVSIVGPSSSILPGICFMKVVREFISDLTFARPSFSGRIYSYLRHYVHSYIHPTHHCSLMVCQGKKFSRFSQKLHTYSYVTCSNNIKVMRIEISIGIGKVNYRSLNVTYNISICLCKN